jgi:hypothetical protein
MANTIASPSSNRHQLDKPTHENLAREILEVRVACLSGEVGASNARALSSTKCRRECVVSSIRIHEPKST